MAGAPGRVMIVFFCFFGLYMPRIFASGPAVFVEKTFDARSITITVSGSGLPEMRGITFTCGYSVSHASIMDAMVASPQPKTALSVIVDSAASSMSIAVLAASTILLADGAPIVAITMTGTANADWPLTMIKAIAVDKQGASTQLPISIKASVRENGGPKLADAAGCLNARRQEAVSGFFDVRGRKVSGCTRRCAPGYYLKTFRPAVTRILVVSSR
jgi:hypothetical protein